MGKDRIDDLDVNVDEIAYRGYVVDAIFTQFLRYQTTNFQIADTSPTSGLVTYGAYGFLATAAVVMFVGLAAGFGLDDASQ